MSVESPAVLDTCFIELPLYQALGDQLHSTFTAVRQYEGFASDVSERAGKEAKYAEEKSILKKGFFYFLTFTVEYDSGEISIIVNILRQELAVRLRGPGTRCRSRNFRKREGSEKRFGESRHRSILKTHEHPWAYCTIPLEKRLPSKHF